MDAAQLQSLQPALERWLQIFEPCFVRRASRNHFQSYLLGLMADLRRKSVEPIALASGTAVRTLQEFLSFFKWDHQRLGRILLGRVANRCCGSGIGGSGGGIGVIDATAHPKRGDKTPGVASQWCGASGKVDNCVVAQHLLFTDNDPHNPFCCMIGCDLFLPECWDQDRARCRAAGIPDKLRYRPKWEIALQQVRDAIAGGVKLAWVVFDEDYGRVPAFWFGLDQLGQNAVGEVPANFHAWVKRPACFSLQACHAARRVDNLAFHSPAFTQQPWQRCTVKDTTRGKLVWEYKAARVHLVDCSGNAKAHHAGKAHHADKTHRAGVPTDRMYWLIVMRRGDGEVKYVISNASEQASVTQLIRVLLSRWHVEKFFERAKQEAGLGAFEVRTYVSLIRHWLCVMSAMCFLAEQTTRLRGEKSTHHLRANQRGGRHPGQQNLEPRLADLVGAAQADGLSPAPQRRRL